MCPTNALRLILRGVTTNLSAHPMKEHPVSNPAFDAGHLRRHSGLELRFLTLATSTAGRATFVAVLYFLAAWISGSLLIRPDRVSHFWPPSGILLAALLLNRPRSWLPLLLLAFPANVFAVWLDGSSPLLGIGFAAATCAGVLLSAWMLRRGDDGPITLSSVGEILRFAAAATTGAAATATLGAAICKIQIDGTSYWFSWRDWWAASTLGVLAFAPPAIAWVGGGWCEIKTCQRRKLLEEIVLLTVLSVVFWITLLPSSTLGVLNSIRNLLYPLLLLNALRFGTRGVATAVLVLATLAVFDSVNETFAVADAAMWQHVLALQVVQGTAIVSCLLLAASFAEREASRSALQLSEERNRLLVNQSPYCIHEIDREGRFVGINPAGLRMLGVDEERYVVGTPYLDAVDDADRGAVAGMLERSWLGETVEFDFRAANRREFQTSVVPLIDQNGQVRELMGLTQDVTERKHVERRLRESEQHLRLGLKAARMYTWVWDFATQGVSYSDGATPPSGSREGNKNLTYSAFLNSVYAEDRDRVKFAVANAINENAKYRIEYRAAGLDGSTRWISVAGTVVRDADGRATKMVGVSVDVTDRKNAEQALRRSEELFRLAIDTSRIGVFTQDRSFRYTWFYNPAGKLTSETIVGQTDAELFAAEDAVQLTALKRFVLDEGVSVRREISLSVHGQTRVVDLHCDPLRDTSGAIVGIMGAARDVTSRRRAEAELEQHRDHLEDLVRLRTEELEASQQRLRQAERLASIGTLAAGIAHEINNPVGTTLLSAEIALAEDGSDPKKIRHCLESIRDDALRCGRIVKSVLQFARQDALEKQPHDLNDVVRRSLEATHRLAQQRGAILHVDLAEFPAQALLNPMAMEHAVVNLINNAIEASHEGDRVNVSTHVHDCHVSISVRDNGPGIAPPQQERIFDPFYTTKQEHGGTGLGLSLAHGIVAEHAGTIRVDSQPGIGATLTIELLRYGGQEAVESTNTCLVGPHFEAPFAQPGAAEQTVSLPQRST